MVYYVRIIFALNLREAENAILKQLGEDVEVVFTATYREALINALPDRQADILILRDQLKGETPMIKMIQDIRQEYSEMRIIFIAGDRKRGDKEIAQIVGLGIYDIICKDSLSISEIISRCRTPRLFRDVSNFYLPDYIPDIELPPEVEPEAPVKKSFFAGLHRGKNTATPTTMQKEASTTSTAPQINAELLRKALKEEATREAQKDLDGLIKSAVDTEMEKSKKALEEARAELKEATNKLWQKESKVKQLSGQLTTEKQRYDALKLQLEDHFKETKEGYKVYEEQLSSLQDGENTPAWYAQQKEKFAAREQELITEINRLRTGMKTLDDKRVSLEEIVKELEEELEEGLSKKDSTKDLEEQIKQLELQVLAEQKAKSDAELDAQTVIQRAEKAKDDAELEAKVAHQRAEMANNTVVSVDNSELVLALQDELDKARTQLNEIISRPDVKPEVKYVEKIIEKPVSITDPAMENAVRNLRKEKTALTLEVDRLSEELKVAKDNAQINTSAGGLDYSTPSTKIPIIPDESSYVKSSSPVRLVIMASGKHGVGNTTVALNLATTLANQGKKTLLMEFNNKHPMTNCYFELMNVPLGIGDALAAVSSNPSAADSAIIRFRALNSANKGIMKVYKKLPAGLHLMTFSNKDLVSTHKSYPTSEGLYALLQYLLTTQHYAHIIMDIQPDEHYILDAVIESGIDIDKLILTTSQDPHGLSTIGKLTASLNNQGNVALLGESELVINKYSRGYSSSSKIAKMLNFNPKRVSTLSDDTEGYVNAVAAGLPYVLTKGHYKAEYDLLYSRIW